ncbi:MAG TPA: phage holin family protein [Burkholderiaceae bacterium]|nr:phage holin family protein [Burkholderiaceae bacterium]
MASDSPGIGFDALRRVAAAVVALGRIKLQLFALEWQEEKARIAQLLLLATLGSLLVGFALIALALTVTVALWDTPHRLVALIVTTVVLGGGAVASVWRIMSLLRGPSPWDSNVDQLQRDEAALRGTGARDGA